MSEKTKLIVCSMRRIDLFYGVPVYPEPACSCHRCTQKAENWRHCAASQGEFNYSQVALTPKENRREYGNNEGYFEIYR